MYEHFEPVDRVFVDREEYLDWMTEALERCKERSVVLHLRGIGGIGKSSLLDHWKNTIDDTIYLDCERYTEFYDRLNVIAKGAVHLGVNLRRFDVLWQIRLRFVEGLEPVKEEGREWAKEVVMAIPFIGSLASIGSAIGAIGAKVSPKLKGKYGELGEWLQARLGTDYIQRLLEILWKEPRRAEFLFLDALLEDLNKRKTSERPIELLMDHSERVDSETCRWRYRGRDITETELWYVFLSSLSNCVGVVASRQAMSSDTGEDLEIEESELTELDRESCAELLDQRGITDTELQDRIISVSGGNPFVIGAICDFAESGSLSLKDVEDLRADTLEAVRLKTWRRLFRETQDILQTVEKAGLMPFFDRRIMAVVAPDMRTDHWDRLIRLSFVRDRGDGTWVLHDLARNLIAADLGQRLQDSTDETAERLEKASTDESDYALLGLAISVRAIAAERDAEARMGSIIFDFIWNYALSDALTFLDAVKIDTKEGQVIVQGLRGSVLIWMNRLADGGDALLNALQAFQKFGEDISDELMVHKARTLRDFGRLLYMTARASEAIETLQKAVEIYRGLDEKTLGFRIEDMARALNWLGMNLISVHRLKEGLETNREAYELFQRSKRTISYNPAKGVVTALLGISTALQNAGRSVEAEDILQEGLGISREIASDRTHGNVIALYLTLDNYGELLRSISRPYEAEQVFLEELSLIRELAKIEPETHLFRLAHTLNNLALPLRQIGRYSKAEKAYTEALEISRELAEKAPDAFLILVAWALMDSAVLYRQTGRVSEAEDACREALSIQRELVAVSPDKYLPRMAWNLNNLAVLLRQTGRIPEAEEDYREALDIAREVTRGAPEAILLTDLLATILNNVAVLLRQTGRISEAGETFQEGLEIRRRLAQKFPELFLHRVATTLSNLGVLLSEADKTSEAESALREALQLRRELVGKSPDLYRSSVGSTLNNLGILLKRTGRTSEAQTAYHEAIDIQEDLVSKAPMVYQHELARTLCNYAHFLSDTDSTDALEKTMARLEELSIKSLPESDEWSEEEEDEANPIGVI
jgi:tetratricopeptide (TPR) repeat protein